jgi:hypothetical protein
MNVEVSTKMHEKDQPSQMPKLLKNDIRRGTESTIENESTADFDFRKFTAHQFFVLLAFIVGYSDSFVSSVYLSTYSSRYT